MIRYAALIALLLASPLANAGVVSRDLFEPGDGLLTYDDVNQREWLDFSVTQGLNELELAAALSIDGALNGFNVATADEVQQLAVAMAAPWRYWWSPLDTWFPETTVVADLIDQLGSNLRAEVLGGGAVRPGLTADTYDISYVYLEGFSSEGIARGHFRALSQPFFNLPGATASSPGYWLYRDAAPVPEPTAAWLAVMACLSSLRLRGFA